MRQRQVVAVERLSRRPEQIEIDGSRTPAFQAFPAEGPFYLQDGSQYVVRRCVRMNTNRAIQEWSLIWPANRRSFIDVRGGHDADSLAEQAHRIS